MRDTCSICLEPNNCSSLNKFTCDHYFHKSCISKWNKSCPNCRSPNKQCINTLNTFTYLFDRLYNGYRNNNEASQLSIDNYRALNVRCVTNNHELELYRCLTPPFGCLLFCLHCKNVTCLPFYGY